MRRPEPFGLPGPLSASELAASVNSIARVQQSCGSVPWPDGHTDAWDHVECAMALTLGGRLSEARAAYSWLRRTQADDGSWAMSYDGLTVLDASVDANQCAYIAVGVWQWWLVTGDRSLVAQMWPHVRRALDFVIDLQTPTGPISWGRDPHGNASSGALLTGCSSIYQSLRCGVTIAELLGEPAIEWELSAGLLQHAITAHRESFLDKSSFSMDWYYPVLAGAVRGAAAVEMIESRWDEFVVAGLGTRCVSDRPWVTGAETAELAISLIIIGRRERAASLIADVQHLREADGSYWTGLVFDEGVRWPAEASSWTSAAMVLACDALAGGSTLDLFSGYGLPTGLLQPADSCDGKNARCSGRVDAVAGRRS